MTQPTHDKIADRATLEQIINETFAALGVTDNEDALLAIDDLKAQRDAHAKADAHWRRMSIETHQAFTTMRDTINECGVAMPSAESALLAGPEVGPAYEAVAQAVVQAVTTLQARVRDADKPRAQGFRAGLEAAAEIADGFNCGGCGMDGKCGAAIRALLPADAPDELAAANALIETLRAQCKTQLDAVPGIVASARADALAEGAAERDALRAEVERLQSALRELVYEVTHLSPESEDGSHLSFISGDALRKARAALAQKEG